MAFIPEPGKPYNLFVQHSGKVLGISRIIRGAKLQQQTFDPAMPQSQQFVFHQVGFREYMIQVHGHNLVLDVSDSAQHSGDVLCLWTRNGDDSNGNQRFKFIYGGPGYYYIRCSVSGKMLDVMMASQDDKAVVIQYEQAPNANAGNQHFRPVLSGADYSHAETMPFVPEVNSERLRDTVISMAGAVPEVGSGLKGLIGFLWPKGQSTVFDQMRNYVETLVKELIEENNLLQIQNKLNGFHDNAVVYEKTSATTKQKSEYFTGMLREVNNLKHDVINAQHPEKRLTYLVSVGSLALGTLREQCVRYQYIYGIPDPDAADHLAQFDTAFADYTAACILSRQRALEWRLKKIGWREEDKTIGLGNSKYTYFASDSYDGWSASMYRTTSGDGTPNARQRMQVVLQNRIEQVTAQFGAELDVLLAPSRTWKYLHPNRTQQPTTQRKTLAMGTYGSKEGVAFSDESAAAGKRITAIVIHAGLWIDGMHLCYDGAPTAMHGGGAATARCLTCSPTKRLCRSTAGRRTA
ncbi:insecticidal delta-endotoxin Cry8Ea1 family protein [Hymenobacter sp. BRD67]|uniref:insecticidal delta-endotoxin Cry8Ea1 family protein n=1 Tax=Hymenobacter sp. BRD67 TaxID=2675877 RepID=UPI0015651F15|nr:insecticidal delta-endotoxin Cry8Ea1 family protein [Hymenobacter sp. BRD67]QKG53665.1 RICIN domain-containing protein [Hymenobacter sp. BRD67]